jgi:hypothetical protein
MVRVNTVLLVAMTATTSACWSSHSSAGRFVTDLDVEGDQLSVTDCEVTYNVQHYDKRTDSFTVSGCQRNQARIPTTIHLPSATPQFRPSPPLPAASPQAPAGATVTPSPAPLKPLPPGGQVEPADEDCAPWAARWRDAQRALAAAQQHAACIKNRTEVSARARQVADVKERTRMYLSIPSCTAVPPRAPSAEQQQLLWKSMPEECHGQLAAPSQGAAR